MVFEIKGKVVLVTGGVSGIGLSSVKEFLRNKVKGICIVDIDKNLANKVLQDLENEFGQDKAIFIEADIKNKQQFEGAFKKTAERFGALDILFNNAGILDDANWEMEIDVNIKGTANGILLGLDYLQKYKSGDEGVIVNCSSNSGVNVMECVPLYSATKFAIVGMTHAFGHKVHFERTKIRVICLCPGATDTPLITNMPGHFLGEEYEKLIDCTKRGQTAAFVAKGLMEIIKNANSGSVWMVEDGVGPYEFVQPDRKTFIPK